MTTDKTLYVLRNGTTYILSIILIFLPISEGLSQEGTDPTCRSKLSKKGAMIYDKVLEKRTANSNLEELLKEVSRDFITEEILGREEAAGPAQQALSCLKKYE